jgi:AraC family transcriptional regulator of adaptative response/methylated-DNA-[protein]-cysteine methyltransferase
MKMKTFSLPKGASAQDPRWAALAARRDDPTKPFVYAVRTTGVFCRPECRSRQPNPEHVVFFATPAEALRAGFRPCKRCQPDGQSYEAEMEQRVLRACRLLEISPETVPLGKLARTIGLSRFHFQRRFKERLGLTPKQYQAAHRLNRLKANLRQRDNVSEAIYDAGFASASRAYDGISRKLGMSPRQYQRGGDGLEIRFALQHTDLGWVLLAATGKGVCAVAFGAKRAELRAHLVAAFPRAELREGGAGLGHYLEMLRRYLGAPVRGLSLPLDIRGTAFQQRVWKELQKIRPGSTATYQEVARRIGRPKAIRAVGSACAANQVALVIPCHRAVRTDGGLGGYRWGLERKRALLERERRVK